MTSIAETPEKALSVPPLGKGRDTALQATIACPPDKSITHRSIMFASMARGASSVASPLLGADCRATVGAFRALGVKIEARKEGAGHDMLYVDSPGWDGWQSPSVPLDYANSGTTARLLTGIFAATPGLFVTCWGDPSLSRRPMARVVEPLRLQGARIVGRDGGRLLPLAINGTSLVKAVHQVDKASAQVKSALLLAGLNIDGETVVSLPAGSRDHTELMVKAMGGRIYTVNDVIGGAPVETVAVRGPFRPEPRQYHVPGDPSSAAFFAVLGALTTGQVTISGVLDNPTRTGFLTALERMGVSVERRTPARPSASLEPVHDLVVHGCGAELQACDLEPSLAPALIDEVPILAVAARFARGTSRMRGLAELRVKESDRLAATIALIKATGGAAWAEGDDLLVQGSDAPVPSFAFDPDGDHRLAMAAAVAAKVAVGPCQIQGPSCVTVSFPEFFTILASL